MPAGRPRKDRQLNPRTIEDIRQKIRADWIIRKLHRHIERGTLEPSAVTAALGLLRKIIPDLSAVDMSATIHKPANELSDAELTNIATGSGERADPSPPRPSELH